MSEIIWYWSLTDLFHLAYCSLAPSTLLQMARSHSFFYGWVISLVIPSSTIADLRVVLFLTFWRDCILFSSVYTSLHSLPSCKRVPLSLHPHQTAPVLFPVLFILAILTGVRWYLIVVLICIALMITDIEHLFMCLLATCTMLRHLEKCLFMLHYFLSLACNLDS